MSEFIRINLHRSAQPDQLAAALRQGFEQRSIDPKFHYLNPRQSQAWLALHKKYAPFAADAQGADVYDSAFNWVDQNLPAGVVHLVSLACGGAGKELRLVKSLQRTGREISATVSDLSVPLVVEGQQTLSAGAGLTEVGAVVLDLLAAGDLRRWLPADRLRITSRVITCFGLMPNVDPLVIAARLTLLLATKTDVLLVGANLVPEANYAESLRQILRGYDNAETRGWLSLLLLDAGFETEDGEIKFTVEPCPHLPELLQIVARFHLRRERTIELAGEPLTFSGGETVRLFFSNRFTPKLLRRVFTLPQIKILGEWVSAEETEGVIACAITSP